MCLKNLPRALRLHLLAILAFLLLTLIVMHPMLFNSGRLVAGFDFFNYNWNFWFIRHALHNGINLYQNDFVFFPSQNNMGYHAYAAFWYPMWAILEPLIGTLHAMNAIIVLCNTLNGYLLFVLLLRFGAIPALALLGGTALQLSPIMRYWLYNTHINLMDWFWLPAHLLIWMQIVKAAEAGFTANRRLLIWAIIQGVGLWGVGLTDLQFPIFVAFALVPYGLWTLLRSPARVRLITAGLVVIAVTLALLWFAGPLSYMARFSGTLAPGPVENRPGITFPTGYLTMHPTWWQWNTPSTGAFPALLLLITLAAAYRLRRQLRVHVRPIWILWLLILISPLLLTLGPTVTILGAEIPGPFRMLHGITRGMFGMPWRLWPIALIAITVLAALVLSPLLAHRPRIRVALFVLALLFLAADTRLGESAPLDPAPPTYAFYEAIGAERGDPYDRQVVLEVPTGVGTGEVLLGSMRAIQLQFYGMQHHKRTVNGFISRAPVESFWPVYRDDPMLAWLGQRRNLEAETVERQLRERIFGWPIGYIVIHQDLVGPDGPTPVELLSFFNARPDLVCPPQVENTVVLYRTRWHPDGCVPRTPEQVGPDVYRINLGDAGDERYLGEGWHPQEVVPGLMVRWTGSAPSAVLYADLLPGRYTVMVRAQAYHRTRTLRLEVNGTVVGSAAVPTEALVDLAFEVPATLIGDGHHITLRLLYDGTDSPAGLGTGTDTRQLALMVDQIALTRRPE